MDITTEERQELIQDVVNAITTQSTSVDELPAVTDLSQTESLPAYRKNSSELVKVPIPLISKPAVDAAAAATLAAEQAVTATNEANQARDDANAAKENAEEATRLANDATASVNQKAEMIDSIRATADRADEKSRKLSEQLGANKITTLTEAEYEAIEEKDADTLYFCTEEGGTTT